MIADNKNNEQASSALEIDRGLHYGDGLFETIAIKERTAELLNKHINRLIKGCKQLKITNVNFDKIRNDIEEKAKSISKGVIKIIVTRGSGGRGYTAPKTPTTTIILLEYPWPKYKMENWISGVNIKKCDLVLSNQPLLAGIKHLNRLENVLARMELENSDFDEGILCNSAGNVIEATSSNVFIIIDKKIITPKLDKCGVSGVMREQIIEKLSQNNISVDVEDVSYAQMIDADEVFLSNSVIGVWPVARLNARIYSTFSTTKKIMALLNIKDYA